ncbi:MAG: hypothetical protein A2445_05625 [Candidatus Jacksonbacteria bacterium RIFOXYC2_FULL_44_29]|nr:MAG: hypothetical protein UW45_C0008G0010 [Parcubacteria group bacterium GW2011_GWC2_44_22]OGY75994.1 MAG: hypothetical protein A2240_05470 [Candidatus Jacksonbacteria bacterium RIFOXYA2_FULL_43_12]OGY76761.1 MAG: hypothetical protein A2295_00275 [Candidatus Jacksonbacteria bacterium RIFOXYB2_FULL_44_15]OGY79167.1 MAG: hypothetical protein A2445_05625 [Candidatus Jacksonbacteria bacterium RIFOXYC2_FULL_44_29]OGY82114.1 MAG: hypothetical protein A2550_00255 [Candidatus Jacksonbacteria bacteri
MFNRILIGIVIAVIAFVLLLKNEWLIRQVGTSAWAEKYLGSEGGTRLMLKLISVLGIIIGLMVITGLHVAFFKWVFSPLTRFNTLGS